MTGEELKNILAHGEGVDTEFKESTHQLARKIYESICAFLNRKGGHIVLGAKDDGRIVGMHLILFKNRWTPSLRI